MQIVSLLNGSKAMDMPIDQLPNSSALKIFVKKPRILLIEDSPLIQRVHVGFLELLECIVDVADCGKKALQANVCDYDLIFMDIGLPDIDGFEICKQMRKENCHVPIIALTAYGDLVAHDIQEAGMNALLTKPSPPEAIEALLRQWLPHLVKHTTIN